VTQRRSDRVVLGRIRRLRRRPSGRRRLRRGPITGQGHTYGGRVLDNVPGASSGSHLAYSGQTWRFPPQSQDRAEQVFFSPQSEPPAIPPGYALVPISQGAGSQTQIGGYQEPRSGAILKHEVDLSPAAETKLKRVVSTLKGSGLMILVVLVAGVAGGMLLMKIIEKLQSKSKK